MQPRMVAKTTVEPRGRTSASANHNANVQQRSRVSATPATPPRKEHIHTTPHHSPSETGAAQTTPTRSPLPRRSMSGGSRPARDAMTHQPSFAAARCSTESIETRRGTGLQRHSFSVASSSRDSIDINRSLPLRPSFSTTRTGRDPVDDYSAARGASGPQVRASRESIERLSRPKHTPVAPDYPYKGARRNAGSASAEPACSSRGTMPARSPSISNSRGGSTSASARRPTSASRKGGQVSRRPRLSLPGSHSSDTAELPVTRSFEIHTRSSETEPLFPGENCVNPDQEDSFMSTTDVGLPLGSIHERASSASSLSSIDNADPTKGSPGERCETPCSHTQVRKLGQSTRTLHKLIFPGATSSLVARVLTGDEGSGPQSSCICTQLNVVGIVFACLFCDSCFGTEGVQSIASAFHACGNLTLVRWYVCFLLVS
jgi:hypothetical protein